MSKYLAALAAVSFLSCGGSAFTSETKAADLSPVQSGHVDGWPEATKHLRVIEDAAGGDASVDLIEGRPPGLGAFWSIASTKGTGTGWFYGDTTTDGVTRIARANVARVQDVTDASALDWSSESVVGPIPAGGIVVVHHPASGRYLALVLDAIDPVDPRTTSASPWAYANVTWYLAASGSASFAAAK